MSTGEQPRPKALVDRPDEGDLQMTMHGLSGIFWVLERLVVDKGLDDFADPSELENGIANLVVAGGILTKQITNRF